MGAGFGGPAGCNRVYGAPRLDGVSPLPNHWLDLVRPVSIDQRVPSTVADREGTTAIQVAIRANCSAIARIGPSQNPHRQLLFGTAPPAALFHAVFRAGRLKKSNPRGLQANPHRPTTVSAITPAPTFAKGTPHA